MKKLPIFIFIFLVLAFLLVDKIESSFLPISEVKIVTPLHYVSKEEVRKTITPLLSGFFSTNMSKLKEKLSQIPFVDEVSIRRRWPNCLQVVLSEQSLVARWNNHEAVNSKGNIVSIDTSLMRLPVFNGPRNQSKEILTMYQEMINNLRESNLKITQVDLNDRGSWQILLNNQYKVILGRKDINTRFNRFVHLWSKLPKQDTDDTFIFDLRYPNGFAMSSFSHKIDKNNNRAF